MNLNGNVHDASEDRRNERFTGYVCTSLLAVNDGSQLQGLWGAV